MPQLACPLGYLLLRIAKCLAKLLVDESLDSRDFLPSNSLLYVTLSYVTFSCLLSASHSGEQEFGIRLIKCLATYGSSQQSCWFLKNT